MLRIIFYILIEFHLCGIFVNMEHILFSYYVVLLIL